MAKPKSKIRVPMDKLGDFLSDVVQRVNLKQQIREDAPEFDEEDVEKFATAVETGEAQVVYVTVKFEGPKALQYGYELTKELQQNYFVTNFVMNMRMAQKLEDRCAVEILPPEGQEEAG